MNDRQNSERLDANTNPRKKRIKKAKLYVPEGYLALVAKKSKRFKCKEDVSAEIILLQPQGLDWEGCDSVDGKTGMLYQGPVEAINKLLTLLHIPEKQLDFPKVLFVCAKTGDWDLIESGYHSSGRYAPDDVREYWATSRDKRTGDTPMHVAARAGFIHKIPAAFLSAYAWIQQNNRGETPQDICSPEDAARLCNRMINSNGEDWGDALAFPHAIDHSGGKLELRAQSDVKKKRSGKSNFFILSDITGMHFC